MKNRAKANLPAAILMLCLLMIWQGAAMGVDAAYILPSPVQVVQKLWELRVPLFTAHLPATMEVVGVGLVISIVLGLGLAIVQEIARRHNVTIQVESREGEGTTFIFIFPRK